MANKINWWIIVAIVVGVAIITSLVTMNLTGNVIKVRKTNYGTDIYTKAEIDGMIGNVVTYQGVLDMFSKCDIVEFSDTWSWGSVSEHLFSGNQICDVTFPALNKSCILTEVSSKFNQSGSSMPIKNGFTSCNVVYSPDSFGSTINIMTMCCSP